MSTGVWVAAVDTVCDGELIRTEYLCCLKSGPGDAMPWAGYMSHTVYSGLRSSKAGCEVVTAPNKEEAAARAKVLLCEAKELVTTSTSLVAGRGDAYQRAELREMPTEDVAKWLLTG